MCIAGSRRGSGESCYQELAPDIHQEICVSSSTKTTTITTTTTAAAAVVATAAAAAIVSTPSTTIPNVTDIASTTTTATTTTITTTAISTTTTTATVTTTTTSTTHRHSRRSSPTETTNFKVDELGAYVKEAQERRSAEITVNSEEQNGVYVRISEDAAIPSNESTDDVKLQPEEPEAACTRRLSDVDRILLESLDITRSRIKRTGRFLTMHKRRRKRLLTRSLNQEPAILDDIFHGLVQCILQKAGNWRFNAFTLETVTGGRSLPVLCVHLFHWYGLLEYFHLDVVTVWKLFAFIEEGYHSTNPYHNSIHATDVTQAMHCFLQEEKIKAHLTHLEVMASLIAAVTHDLDHPGVNQPFLVATSNHLAALYQNTSVLENHHWRSAIGCLIESGVSDQLPVNIRSELQSHISSLILATDITRQQEFLTRFRHYLDENTLDMRKSDNRHFILQIALKCADISNPCRPWDISRKWSYKVCEEFFRQGDYERRLNLPVTPLCDRHSTSIPKIQVGFFKFVVTPLYEEWHRFLGDGLSVSLMEYLRSNQKKWENLIAQETAEDTETEISELEEVDIISSGEELTAEDDSGSIDLLIPTAYIQGARRPSLPGKAIFGRVDRRHSVPLSVSKPLSLSIQNSDRRDSFPNERGNKSKNHSIKLKDLHLLDPSTLSLLSSKNSITGETSEKSTVTERPVSAENLLPEPSIASITNSSEASRLSTVLQSDNQKVSSVGGVGGGTQTKQLTRQQTFPPLQPYARMRYMSATAELSQCYTQVLMETDSISSSSSSPTKDKSCSGGRCGTPPVLDADLISLKKANGVKSSKESLSTDISNRKRPSVFTEINRQKLESGLSAEHPRRHSMQVARNDDLNATKQTRHKRPASAQEIDSTEVFYASLTGSHSNKDSTSNMQKIESNLEIKPSTTKLPSEEIRNILANKISEQHTLVHHHNIQIKNTDSELRRYSTPVTEPKPLTDNTGRRFTTIPVSSELPTHKFFIGSPPDSPPRVQSVSSSSDSGIEPKKNIGDSTIGESVVTLINRKDSDYVRERVFKIAKLNFDVQMKENVDPRSVEESSKNIALSRKNSQGLEKRRGSAPVALLSRLDDFTITSVQPKVDHSCRRGSVPTDITRHQDSSTKAGFNRLALGPREENLPAPRRASLPQEAALKNILGNVFSLSNERENCPLINNNNNNNNNTESSNNNGTNKVFDITAPGPGMPSPRRGSIPADMSELRRELFSKNGNVNGKSRNRKKLKRRSSGGPEMFAGSIVEGNDIGTSHKWKRELGKRDSVPEPLVKRRGSLPLDMVAASHAGWI
ncbi:uncharacterized protein LOC122519624 isoform X2 [Polistes fuscatus]|uniref:uncharacterized protein LOC122519624 isoform X2 n=1 Tax=Polistes fuscatus TaxID=30207 RepID=UPI001CA82164|nr:uncharacterized protein LOC122519624 isoform X2 [Polistes fuscatus]